MVAVATSRHRWRVPRLKVAKAIMSAFFPSWAIRASRGLRFGSRSAALRHAPPSCPALPWSSLVSPDLPSSLPPSRDTAACRWSLSGIDAPPRAGPAVARHRFWGRLEQMPTLDARRKGSRHDRLARTPRARSAAARLTDPAPTRASARSCTTSSSSAPSPGADGRERAEIQLDELEELARTLGTAVVERSSIPVREPHPATFFRSGAVEALKARLAELGSPAVLVNDQLSPRQQRNLQEAWEVPVLDRTEVILAIFARRAVTAEGKIQVEMAQLEHLLPRLAGGWTHLERQRGGVGLRGGPGETQIEVDRRLIRQRIAKLRRRLELLERQRRTRRQARSDVPLAACRPGRLHQRRQVDAPQPAHQLRGARRQPPLRHPRPDLAPAQPLLRAAGDPDRHGRIHPGAADRAGRGLRRHPGGGPPGPPARPGGRRLPSRSATPSSGPSWRRSPRWSATNPTLLVANKIDRLEAEALEEAVARLEATAECRALRRLGQDRDRAATISAPPWMPSPAARSRRPGPTCRPVARAASRRWAPAQATSDGTTSRWGCAAADIRAGTRRDRGRRPPRVPRRPSLDQPLRA